MKPVLFLRIASILTLFHTAGHTIGAVFGKPAPGAQQAAVWAMKTNQFQLMGLTRSYWDFHLGVNLAVSVMLAAEAVVFWQLASLARADASRLRPIVATFLVGYLGLAAISYEYFFAPPLITEILIALCMAMAILTSKAAVSTGKTTVEPAGAGRLREAH